MDFQSDATADGRRLKFLNVIDEYRRLCLEIHVGRRCKAKDVVAVLEDLTNLYPAPAFIRSDNGPSSLPVPYGAGVKAAAPQPLTSSPAPRGRTALLSHSTAGSQTSSSTPNCLPRWLRSRAWPIAGAGSTTPSGTMLKNPLCLCVYRQNL